MVYQIKPKCANAKDPGSTSNNHMYIRNVFISVLFSIPSGGARTKKKTRNCVRSLKIDLHLKFPRSCTRRQSSWQCKSRWTFFWYPLFFLVTKRKMITKCGGMESGHLRSLRPSLRGTDVCTHMHESPTAEHANGGEPVMVLGLV